MSKFGLFWFLVVASLPSGYGAATAQSSIPPSPDDQASFAAGQSWVDGWEGVPQECLRAFAQKSNQAEMLATAAGRLLLAREVQIESGRIDILIMSTNRIVAGFGQYRELLERQYLDGEIDWEDYKTRVARLNRGWQAGVDYIDSLWADAQLSDGCGLRNVP